MAETDQSISESIPNQPQDQDESKSGDSDVEVVGEAGCSRPPDIEPRGNNKPATITNTYVGLSKDTLPPIDETRLKECEECHMEFLRSYLYKNFAVFICDDCRDPKEKHELITRTDAKSRYLLKDCDIDLREPILRYILKKNPYQSRGDMRLYLKYQIEERALAVHGSEEQLEEELERREERRAAKKQKVFDKKMKSLSMQVRSSLYKRNMGDKHEHEYGEPVCINEDDDIYQRVCQTCGYKYEYEEL